MSVWLGLHGAVSMAHWGPSVPRTVPPSPELPPPAGLERRCLQVTVGSAGSPVGPKFSYGQRCAPVAMKWGPEVIAQNPVHLLSLY